MHKTVSHDLARLCDDPRTITSVHDNQAQISWVVGRDGVTAIKAYREEGPGGYAPWLAIYINGVLLERIDAQGKQIRYG